MNTNTDDGFTTNTDEFELCLATLLHCETRITEFLKFRTYRHVWALLDLLDNKEITKAEQGFVAKLGHREVFADAGKFLSFDDYELLDAAGTYRLFQRCTDSQKFLVRKLYAFDCKIDAISIRHPISNRPGDPSVTLKVFDEDAGLSWTVNSFTIPLHQSVEQATSAIKEFVMSGYEEVATGNIGSYKFTVADFNGAVGTHQALPFILRTCRLGCQSIRSIAHRKPEPERKTLKKPAKAAVKIKPARFGHVAKSRGKPC